jgi:hypothetical protein
MNRSRISIWSLVGFLLVLVGYSLYLSLNRIYQVDEFQNFYMARVFAMGQSSEFLTTSSLFLFGPLSWLAKSHLSSTEMMTGARAVFLVVFWVNLLLIARIAAGSLFSLRGLFALTAAATLAPLWDYGFEIRHDNIILTGILLMWWLVRSRRVDDRTYVFVSLITVIMLFIAVKAAIYAIPLSFVILVFPPPEVKSRWRSIVMWVGGLVVSLILVRLCFGFSGAWDNYLSIFRGVSHYSSGAGGSGKFKPWDVTLSRLLTQTPLLVAITVAALIAVVVDLVRRKKVGFSWNSMLPEALLCLGTFGALVTNPTPFPYNLVNFVPFMFILAFKYVSELRKEIRLSKDLCVLIATVFVFLHLAPFATATYRHVDFANARQRQLMNLAEQMTDPSKDRVYDGIGMVPTRRSVHYHWFLHSLAAALITTPGTRVRDMLDAQPAPVLMESYRTDWLPKEDHDFINARYVPLADDFEVLGKVLPVGGGNFEIFHPGRYCVVPAASLAGRTFADSAEAGKDPVMSSLDGFAISNKPLELTAGTHRLETSEKSKLAVVWIGPTLDHVPSLAARSHELLFINWY